MDLSIYGHFNIDILINVEKLPNTPGSIPGKNARIRPGGTGRNIAKIAGMLGIENELIAFVGKDFPKEFIVDLSNFSHVDKIRVNENFGYSPICFIISDGNEQMAIIDQGPMEKPEEILMPDGKIVIFSTGYPEYYIKIKNLINDKIISFDPGQEIFYRYDKEKIYALMNNTEFSFFNENEFKYLLNFYSEKDLLKLSKNIIVTLGEKGCMLINDKKIKLDAYKTEKKETVGAGDAFRAGFLFGMLNHYDLVNSCKIGMKVASNLIKNGSLDIKIDIKEVIESL